MSKKTINKKPMNKKPNKKKKEPLERVGTVSIDILPFLKNGKKRNEYVEMQGYRVKVTSQRYMVFKDNPSCVTCGLEGSFLAIEKAKGIRSNSYHLNLYGVTEDGEEVLMTKDHIKPRSRGGTDTLDNYQTMCARCNTDKADLPVELPEEIVEQLYKHKKYNKNGSPVAYEIVTDGDKVSGVKELDPASISVHDGAVIQEGHGAISAPVLLIY